MSTSRFPTADVSSLQDMLVEYLVGEARRLSEAEETNLVAVSLGAAIDAGTGRIVGASPLWGPTEPLDFDLYGRVVDALPACSWTIENDLTAAALGVAMRPEFAALRRLAVVAVGSGLAMRTIEPGSGRISMSKHSGLQGEIGHLPASFAFGEGGWSVRCPCGGFNHLSSFASGQGIAYLLKELGNAGCEWLARDPTPAQLSRAVRAANPEAREFLDAITDPLAQALLAVLAIDAEVERLVLVGGVVDGLGDAYMRSLLTNMSRHGLYGSRLKSPADFAEIVCQAPAHPSPMLFGAASAAWSLHGPEAGAYTRR
jgi:2-epi-5-epi-valiolone 7-kinase